MHVEYEIELMIQEILDDIHCVSCHLDDLIRVLTVGAVRHQHS